MAKYPMVTASASRLNCSGDCPDFVSGRLNGGRAEGRKKREEEEEEVEEEEEEEDVSQTLAAARLMGCGGSL